jgi:methionyl-tRNA formyltransferase
MHQVHSACKNPPVRIIFFGTPEFAVPTLDALAGSHEVVLVVAQPDRPAGRGMKLQPPAVAVRAQEIGLPLIQPAKIRSQEFLDAARDVRPDAGVVVAYGRILPSSLLAIPEHGFLNVHASVLPRWRGAAPIQRALEAGDRVTGVTIMRVDEELDHGPTFEIVTTEIGPDERAPALFTRLSSLGNDALLRTLAALDRGTAVEHEQDHARATLAPKIEKSEGEVHFETATATQIYDRFRAFDPWPGSFLRAGEETIKLTDMAPEAGGGEPGTILDISAAGVLVAAKENAIRIIEMQRPGKPRTAAAALARSLGWTASSLVREN